ncbi:MAG TPA: TRAP transporter substrate-binding protein [Ideonella sp.]|jgi:TRAP-type C4-dicarboxylate transport system substrate-binding protein|nr:TRAP transporter substrate-binding protein [Ideonella sp.]
MPAAKTSAGRAALALLAALAAAALNAQPAPPAATPVPAASTASNGPAQVTLRVVGGVAGLNQFTRHEEPFWSRELPRLSGGRLKANIVPFDRAGIRGQDMLRLMQLGVVPFGTALVSQSSATDPLIAAPDLAGLNPDFASLKRHTSAFRPLLEKTLRERYGIELLAVYVYPAQMLFCKQALTGLGELAGRQVRTSSPTQADWVEALGGKAVATPFAELAEGLRSGGIDCALTGSMSGYTIGLQQLTHHLFTMPVNWGMSIFGAHGASWQALPAEQRALLKRELARLEQSIWAEAERDTTEGVRCLTGAQDCGGLPGRLSAHAPSAADDQRRRLILSGSVIVRWVQRCGGTCADAWNQTIGPLAGVEAKPQ